MNPWYGCSLQKNESPNPEFEMVSVLLRASPRKSDLSKYMHMPPAAIVVSGFLGLPKAANEVLFRTPNSMLAFTLAPICANDSSINFDAANPFLPSSALALNVLR